MICGTCKYWVPIEHPHSEKVGDPSWNQCRLALPGYAANREAGDPEQAFIAEDAEAYWAWLVTHREHSCLSWNSKTE